ncbi:MAG TPA: rhodanese-like domain-containing protein [Polyangiaceae bacterium]|nr:rhodanese-like domain-containing protein [Polyangiaceae bacterium]
MWWLPFGAVPEITAAELAARLAKGERLQLLDVRTRREHAQSRVPGAVSVPITELSTRLDELDPQRPTVAICLSAHRSVPAVRLLQRRGFRDVVQLAGGMRAWWSLVAQ